MTAWYWVPMRDLEVQERELDPFRRLRLLADAYGLTDDQRPGFMDVMEEAVGVCRTFVAARVANGERPFVERLEHHGGWSRWDRIETWLDRPPRPVHRGPAHLNVPVQERVRRKQPASGPPPAAATATSGWLGHLALAGLAPQLQAGLVEEPVAVEAPGRQLAAVGVERDLAVAGDAAAALEERAALAVLAEAQRLEPAQRDEAEAVVQLGHVDVGRA